MLGTKHATFTDGRTKQSFRDETDINQILKRAQKSGTISHISKYEARYGDFTGFDFFAAQLKLSQGAEIFAELPVELRREFNQSPAEFFNYVNDPANEGRVAELLPALAEPGRQNINTSGVIPADTSRALEAAAEPAAAIPPAEPETPPTAPTAPPAASPAAPTEPSSPVT